MASSPHKAEASAAGDDGTESAGTPKCATADEFDQLYEQHHDFVWQNMLRLGVCPAAVDDATQEVFLVVSRKLAGFEGRSSFRTWLFAIMIRVARQSLRGESRWARFRRELSWTQSAPIRADQLEEPQRRRSEAAETLHRLLQRLSEAKRVVFIMSELEGMTGPEIADALGIGLPAVYARLRKAKAELEVWAEKLKRAEALAGRRSHHDRGGLDVRTR